LQFPPLQTTLTATNHPQPSQPHQPICQQVQTAYISTTHVNQIPSLMQPNISNPRSGAAWPNEDDLEMSNRETLRKHQWQTVCGIFVCHRCSSCRWVKRQPRINLLYNYLLSLYRTYRRTLA
jgi:hypothetical protein